MTLSLTPIWMMFYKAGTSGQTTMSEIDVCVCVMLYVIMCFICHALYDLFGSEINFIVS